MYVRKATRRLVELSLILCNSANREMAASCPLPSTNTTVLYSERAIVARESDDSLIYAFAVNCSYILVHRNHCRKVVAQLHVVLD